MFFFLDNSLYDYSFNIYNVVDISFSLDYDKSNVIGVLNGKYNS